MTDALTSASCEIRENKQKACNKSLPIRTTFKGNNSMYKVKFPQSSTINNYNRFLRFELSTSRS